MGFFSRRKGREQEQVDAALPFLTVSQAAEVRGLSPGSVSPHVYWTDGTTVDQLTQHDEAGRVSVVVSPRFQEVLETIAARG